MKQETTYRDKGRAVFLAAIMVISVLAIGGAGLAGSAAAINAEDPGDIPAVVFQGEEVTVTFPDAEEYDYPEDDDGNEIAQPTDGDLIQLRAGIAADDLEDTERVDTERVSDGQVTFETETLTPDFYFLRYGGQDDTNTQFEIIIEDLEVDFQDDTVADDGQVDLEIVSEDRDTEVPDDDDRQSFAVEINSTDLDHDDIYDLLAGADEVAYTVPEQDDDDDDDPVVVEGVTNGTLVEFDFDNADVDTGVYEFDVEVVDTTGADSAEIDVVDVDEGALEFEEDTVEQNVGDVAQFNVTFEGDAEAGYVQIGDEDDDGYEIVIYLVDDEEDGYVEFEFNTWLAGQFVAVAGGEYVNFDGEPSELAIEDVEGEEYDGYAPHPKVVEAVDDGQTVQVAHEENISGFLLPADAYETLTLNNETAPDALDSEAFEDLRDTLSDDPDDIGTLFLEDRSTDAISTWTAPNAVLGDITAEDEADQFDALAAQLNENVTLRDDIANSTEANSDVVIHQIEASGIFGMIAADDDGFVGALEAWADDDHTNETFALRVRQTRDTTPAFADRKLIDFGAMDESGDLTVIADEETNQVFLAYNIDDAAFETDHDELEAEEAYLVEYRVHSDRLLAGEDDPEEDYAIETVTAMMDIIEADGEFVNDNVNVTAEAGVLIEGETNIAPGNELNIRVRSTGDTRPGFSKTASDVVVDADGDFAGEFDFSEQNPGDTYSVRVTQTLFELDEDGAVVSVDVDPAVFAVADLDAPAAIDAGDEVTVSATITNTGEAEATQEIEWQLEGDVVDSEAVTLDADEDTTVEFTATPDLAAGEYTHGIYSDDDSQTATLTVEAVAEETPTPTPEPTPTPTEEETPTPTEEPTPTPTEEPTPEPTPTPTEEETPGFGAIAALIALIAAGLLAYRRR